MGSWLTGLTAACCAQLGTVGDTLNQVKDRYMYWNNDYYQKAQALTSQRWYEGAGATAFMQAVDTDINVSRPVYDGIGHVGSASHNLQNAIATSSAKYDAHISSLTPLADSQWQIHVSVFAQWQDHLVQTILEGATRGGNKSDLLGSIFTDGGPCLFSAYSNAEGLLAQIADNDAEAYYLQDVRGLIVPAYLDPAKDPDILHNPDLTQQSNIAIQDALQARRAIHDYYHRAANLLSTDVEVALELWAGDIWNGYQDFQAAMKNSEEYLSARDIYDLIYNDSGGSQSTTKPITITPYTKNGKTGLLITIGGTDPTDWAWDTDLFTALQTGMGLYNPYLDDVQRAIVVYMREHPEMAGSEVTFAGYSLGGMTAQQMAQDIAGGQDSELNDIYHLHVAQMITYGSPVMGPPLSNVNYAMYDATYDPIPLLSHYENPLLDRISVAIATASTASAFISKNPLFLAPLSPMIGSLVAADLLPWDEKLHHYIDSSGQYGNQIHNITDVGNTPGGNGPVENAPPGGTNGPLVLQNHMEYQWSDQLNAQSTGTGIDPTTLGPTEYFGMKNTDNLYAQAKNTGSLLQSILILEKSNPFIL